MLLHNLMLCCFKGLVISNKILNWQTLARPVHHGGRIGYCHKRWQSNVWKEIDDRSSLKHFNLLAANVIIFLLETTTFRKFLVLFDFLFLDSAWSKSNGK